MSAIKDNLGTVASIITSLSIIIAVIWKPTKKKLKNLLIEANEPLEKQINVIHKELDTIKEERLIDERDTLRRNILSFSNDVRNSKIKTQKQYEEFFKMADKYELILTKLHETNGYIDSEVEYVRSVMNNIER